MTTPLSFGSKIWLSGHWVKIILNSFLFVSFIKSYHGAKNLMKTAFPAVAEWKLSGVRLITSPPNTEGIKERRVKEKEDTFIVL